MKRDMRKAIDDYKSKFWGRKDGKGRLTAGDSLQVIEIADKEGGTISDYVDNAMMAGFMIGYRLGLKEQAKGGKKA